MNQIFFWDIKYFPPTSALILARSRQGLPWPLSRATRRPVSRPELMTSERRATWPSSRLSSAYVTSFRMGRVFAHLGSAMLLM